MLDRLELALEDHGGPQDKDPGPGPGPGLGQAQGSEMASDKLARTGLVKELAATLPATELSRRRARQGGMRV